MPKLLPLNLQSNETKREKFFSLILAYMLTFQGLSDGVNVMFNFLGMQTPLDTAVLYLSLILMIVVFLLWLIQLKRLYIDEVLLLFLIAVPFTMTCFIPGGYSRYLSFSLSDFSGNSFLVLFIYALPAYLLIRRIRNYSYLYKYMVYFSYVVVSLSVFTYFCTNTAFAESYMTLAYNMLLQTVVLLLHKPRKYKLLHYALAALGCFVIAVGGARGALLGLLIVAALMLFVSNYSAQKKVLLILLVVVLIIVSLSFYNEIVIAISGFLEHIGIKSRTFELLFSKTAEISFDSGRSLLMTKALQSITLVGRGLFADRAILNGSYAHNLFIELLVHYGYIIGGMLCCYILWLIISALLKTKKPEWRLIVMLIPNGFIMLMLSNSYLLQNPCFYALLGICINALHKTPSMSFTSKAHLAAKR